jgi:hypothetical protein
MNSRRVSIRAKPLTIRLRNRLTRIDPELPYTTGSFRAVNQGMSVGRRYRLQLIITPEHDRRLDVDTVQFETQVALRRIAGTTDRKK